MQEVKISASVGENAKNNKQDVIAIQKSLNRIIEHNVLVPLAPLKEDGIAGKNTKTAIRQFQRVSVGVASPDGRVDVAGRTIKKINEVLMVCEKLKNKSGSKSIRWSIGDGLDHLISETYRNFNKVQKNVLAGVILHKSEALNVAPTTNNDLGRLSKSDFVGQVFSSAKAEEVKSKIPAAITTAQAILETGFGKSVPTDLYTKQYSYNLFGVKGIGPAGYVSVYTHEVIKGVRIKIIDKFEAYHSFEGSIAGRTAFLKRNQRYRVLFGSADPVFWAEGLQKAGYATDPNYAKTLIQIMKSWKLV
jgi:flagellum-specific peptidoglycan hydrolase FlgJ